MSSSRKRERHDTGAPRTVTPPLRGLPRARHATRSPFRLWRVHPDYHIHPGELVARAGELVIDDGSRNYRDLYQETVKALGRMIEALAGSGVKPVIETHFSTIAPSASLAYRLVQHFGPTSSGV